MDDEQHDLEEPALVARARSGDDAAFAVLVRHHADRLHAQLRRFGLTAGEAEDVAQETFLRAWRGLGSFEQRSRFSTWLYRIGFNEAQRRLSRRPPPTVDDAGVAERLDDPGRGPEARALGRELSGRLELALGALPLERRVAVVLRDVEGLSTAEAAEIVGIREAAFKSRLHRGRMTLRASLEPELLAGD